MEKSALKTINYSIGLGLAILATTTCSTTTIQTGGTQYKGPEYTDRKIGEEKKQPENTFFNEMSSKDDAFKNNNIEEQKTEREFIDAQKQDTAIIDREAINKNKLDDKRPIDYNEEAVVSTNDEYELNGVSSWYGRDFDGRPTASGVIYDSRKLTAAHKKIPLGSIALIRNTDNDKEILVTINDRGPFIKGRILDVSEYGAELLGFKEQGLTNVEIKIVRLGKKGKVSKKGKGATYDFFGPESGYESNVGAGDDAQANVQIDRMLDREEQKNKERLKLPQIVKNEIEQIGYAVQIGVFSDKRNAFELQKFIQTSGNYTEPARVYQRGSLFTVKVGSFSSHEQAEILKIRFIDEGYRAFVSAPKK